MAYPEEQRCIELDYKFLGWQAHPENTPEIANCVAQGHNKDPNAWKDAQHTRSGSNCTFWCEIDKIYWKIDMS